MNRPPTEPSRDDRFDEVCAEFLEAVEAGQRPDEAEFAAAHPEFEQSLLAFFTDYRRMGGLLEGPAAEDPHGPAKSQDADAGGPVEATADFQRTAGVAATPPRELGDFVLLEKIAEGGMGVVYKAKQKSLNRIVALKMIRSGEFADHEEVQRFHREAEAAAKLDHPGIVPIYQVGEQMGQHYFAMAYVNGRSLAQMIRQQRIAPQQAADYLRKIALAVHFAHQHGIIHRDLKPGNVLVDEQDEPKITDFGLAKQVDSEHSLTTSGQIVGTISYMPPEQASGSLQRVSTCSDVYSLGALLYALLTQKPPFQADNPLDVLMKVITDVPLPPSKVGQRGWHLFVRGDPDEDSSFSGSTWRFSKIPADLDTICLKCLEKDPKKRYATAKELAEDLDRFLTGKPLHAHPVSFVERTFRWCRRKPALSAATLLLMLITVATPLAMMNRDYLEASRRYWARLYASARGHSAPQTVARLDEFLLEQARSFYAEHPFKITNDDSAAIRSMRAAAHAMLLDHGNSEAYEAGFTNLISHLREQLTSDPANSEIQSALADCHVCLGDLHVRAKFTGTQDRATAEQQAKTHYRQAEELLSVLRATFPDNDHLKNRYAFLMMDLVQVQDDAQAKLRQLERGMTGTQMRNPRGVVRFEFEPSAAVDPGESAAEVSLDSLWLEASQHRGDVLRQLALADGLRRAGEYDEAWRRYQVAFLERDRSLREVPLLEQIATAYRDAAKMLRESMKQPRLALTTITEGIALRLQIESATTDRHGHLQAIREDFTELGELCREWNPRNATDTLGIGEIWPRDAEAAYYAILTIRSNRPPLASLLAGVEQLAPESHSQKGSPP